MQKFDHIKFIEKLLEFSPRQGENETQTREFICSILDKEKIAYELEKFVTQLPKVEKASLIVDGKNISCEPTGFVSGQINNKHSLISSLISSQLTINQPNINFNPECDAISLSNFYFAPSLAVSKHDLPEILESRKISAELKVNPVEHESANILVGNTKNPKNILIAHYDCHKTGATDNASGVSVLMSLILGLPQTLKNTLYVFSGNEEISYDQPIYWGHGF